MSELFSAIEPFRNLVKPRDNGLNGSWTIFRPTLQLRIILQNCVLHVGKMGFTNSARIPTLCYMFLGVLFFLSNSGQFTSFPIPCGIFA